MRAQNNVVRAPNCGGERHYGRRDACDEVRIAAASASGRLLSEADSALVALTAVR
jgi:hypothetical protein